jgi:hypothetical protein
MTENRITAYAADIRAMIASGRKADGSGPIGDLAALDSDLDLTFEEHYRYQEAQAQAHLAGALTTEEAQTVYRALGEGGPGNGGWAARTDLALKVTVTNLMVQLIAADVRRRMGV